MPSSEVLGDVLGAVDDDRAFEGQVVHARFEPVQVERVAVPSLVGAAGGEEPEARLLAAVAVGELPGVVRARPLAVGDQLILEHGRSLEIEDPEARLGGGQRVVDDRQDLGALQESPTLGVGAGDQSQSQHLGVEGRGRVPQGHELEIERDRVGGRAADQSDGADSR